MASDGAKTSPTGAWAPWAVAALLLLLAVAWRFGFGSGPEPGGPSPGDSPGGGIVSGEGSPPPCLWDVQASKSVQAPGEAGTWTTLKHPTYEYEVDSPGDWAVGSPAGFTRERGRILEAPSPSQARIVVIPWGIYDQPVLDEVEKAEGGWLLSGPRVVSARRTDDRALQVGDREALRRQYEAVLKNGDAEEPWRAVATFVVARPKCYALILLCPESEVPEFLGLYERVVDSFAARNPDGHPPGSEGPSPGPEGAGASPAPSGGGPSPGPGGIGGSPVPEGPAGSPVPEGAEPSPER